MWGFYLSEYGAELVGWVTFASATGSGLLACLTCESTLANLFYFRTKIATTAQIASQIASPTTAKAIP